MVGSIEKRHGLYQENPHFYQHVSKEAPETGSSNDEYGREQGRYWWEMKLERG